MTSTSVSRGEPWSESDSAARDGVEESVERSAECARGGSIDDELDGASDSPDAVEAVSLFAARTSNNEGQRTSPMRFQAGTKRVRFGV
jgi:hypothetical protein